MIANLWAIVFGIGVAQGLCLLLLLRVLGLTAGPRGRILAGLVAILTLLITTELAELFFGAERTAPLLPLTASLDLLLGPLLLLLARDALGQEQPGRRALAPHLLPFVIAIIAWGLLLATAPVPAAAAGDGPAVALVAGKFVVLLAYLVRAERLLGAAPGGQPVFARRLRRQIRVVLALLAVIYGHFFLLAAGYTGLPDSDHVGSLLLALVIYYLTFAVILERRAWARPALPTSPPPAAGPLVELFERDGLHRDPDCDLAAVADRLGVSRNRASELVNATWRDSLPVVLNRYRLADFEQALRADPGGERTILEHAFNAGFNSKAAFYRAFRAQRGMTPTAFRASLARGD